MMDIVMPYSQEIEDSVIRSMIYDEGFALWASGKLNEDDFHQTHAKTSLRHILPRIIASGHTDHILLLDDLKRASEYKNGIGEYLAHVSGVSDASPDLLPRLKDLASRRKMMVSMYKGLEACSDLSTDHKTTVEAMHSTIIDLEGGKTKNGPELICSILSRVISTMETTSRGSLTGVSTGLYQLDCLSGGLEYGELVVVAGRPSMGKTALAECIAHEIAKTSGVVFFSQEMDATKLAMRAMCRESGISMIDIRKATLPKAAYPNLYESTSKISDRKLWIDDTSGVSVMDIISGVKSLRGEQVSMIVVDYIQLMRMSDKRQNREQGLAEISRALKGLARQTNTVVVALAQLSREVERREDKRPMMSDLRESGAIEQDADKVILLYRDDYYNVNTDKKGVAEIIVAKNRNGETGTVEVEYIGHRMKFVSTKPQSEPGNF